MAGGTTPLTIAVLVACGGCDRLFPIHDTRAPDAALRDAPGADAASCPAGGKVVQDTDAVADAMISESNPAQGFGTLEVANVGAGLPSRGLFRFPISTALGPPVELRVRLRYAIAQSSCNTACGSCLPLEHDGTLSGYAANNGWLEESVTWNEKRTGVSWTVPGADSPTSDRSTFAVSATHVAGQDTELTWTLLDATEAASWISVDRLSILIEPGPGTVMVATTHEGVANNCVADDHAATLSATFCNP